MTYKEIINRFRQAANEHRMIKDFGYGQLSDIKTQSQLGPEEDGADYPYMFLNSTTSNRNGSVMLYSFNMIMMDMARPEEGDRFDNYITIQSDCQQYIDDILARMYYFYTDKPDIQLTGISYTPFKEKYQDELAGMTATITIAVPTPINECIAPFENWVLQTTLSTTNLSDGVYNFQNVFDQYEIPETPALYKIEWDFRVANLKALTGFAAPHDKPTFTVSARESGEIPQYVVEQEYSGVFPNSDIQLKGSAVFALEDDSDVNDKRLFFGLGYMDAVYPGTTTPVVEITSATGVFPNGTLKIYKNV